MMRSTPRKGRSPTEATTNGNEERLEKGKEDRGQEVFEDELEVRMRH
jgi:hypothetical protein